MPTENILYEHAQMRIRIQKEDEKISQGLALLFQEVI
jgi:hypothetical protein